MTNETNIPDPPDVVPVPDEIIASVAASILGTSRELTAEEQDELDTARTLYVVRQSIACRGGRKTAAG
jgi:hypothetical protein